MFLLSNLWVNTSCEVIQSEPIVLHPHVRLVLTLERRLVQMSTDKLQLSGWLTAAALLLFLVPLFAVVLLVHCKEGMKLLMYYLQRWRPTEISLCIKRLPRQRRNSGQCAVCTIQ